MIDGRRKVLAIEIADFRFQTSDFRLLTLIASPINMGNDAVVGPEAHPISSHVCGAWDGDYKGPFRSRFEGGGRQRRPAAR